jgi:uncharacterized tellurite resistance protein B-like protein
MIALIIFGTRGIRSTIEEGNFQCPQCASEQKYKHKKVTQFFTLYFIPLIPISKKGTYVECQKCKNTYIERVLNMEAEIKMAAQEQEATPREQSVPVRDQKADIPPVVEALPKETVTPPPVVIAAAQQSKSNAILSEKQKAMRKLLIMMILADGKVEDAEIKMFHKVYKELANDVVADIYKEIEIVKTENKLPHQYLREVASGLNDEGKNDLLKASMMIAASDGDIDPLEVRMVEQFGRALYMRPGTVKEIIESIKV